MWHIAMSVCSLKRQLAMRPGRAAGRAPPCVVAEASRPPLVTSLGRRSGLSPYS